MWEKDRRVMQRKNKRKKVNEEKIILLKVISKYQFRQRMFCTKYVKFHFLTLTFLYLPLFCITKKQCV